MRRIPYNAFVTYTVYTYIFLHSSSDFQFELRKRLFRATQLKPGPFSCFLFWGEWESGLGSGFFQPFPSKNSL